MRIGMDVRKIGDTGIGRYIENLVENLLAVDGESEYVLFFAPRYIHKYNYPADRVIKVSEASGKYSIAEHISIPRKAGKYHIDLFHAPHYVLPYFMKQPSVVTVHDIIHLKEPTVGLFAKQYAKAMISSAVGKAHRVLTVSQSTKKDLVEYFDIDPDKIKITYNGGGADFSPLEQKPLAAALERLDIVAPYYLYVGSDRPHKNLKAVDEVLKQLNDDARFVIVGRVGKDTKRLFTKFGDRAMFLDNVAKPDMNAIYTGAAALLFPSYMEGFGLPPLEAMACDTPVVCSNQSCLPEIVGEAAVLVDPDDHQAQADALMRLTDNKAIRAELVKLGHERLKHFSWTDTAKLTLQCYREVIE